jgi:hypothetical protein
MKFLFLILLVFVSQRAGSNPLEVDPAKECKKVGTAVPRQDCWKEWLVVVYMAADNDLSPYSFRDLWEMERVGSSASVDIVVYLDTADPDGSKYFHLQKSSKRIDYDAELARFVREGKTEETDPQKQEEDFLNERGPSLVTSTPRKVLPEEDSGRIETAGDYFSWAMSNFPSRRLMVIGWSHGEGFDAGPSKVSEGRGKQGGFAFDFTSRSHMGVIEMASGMARLLKTYRRGNAIDVAGSDACLNQQIEFGYEWVGRADYVFGSSTIVQKKGFNYRSLFSWLVDRPYVESSILAAEIPRIYERNVSKYAKGTYSSYYDPDFTMATWTTSELIYLRRALDAVGQGVAAWLHTGNRAAKLTELKGALKGAERIAGVSNDLFSLLQALQAWVRQKVDRDPDPAWRGRLNEINASLDNLNRSTGVLLG